MNSQFADTALNNTGVSKSERMFFGFLLFMSVSSLILLNKEDLIKYNIAINTVYILCYFMWALFKEWKIAVDSVVLSYSLFVIFCIFSILWSVDADVSASLVFREVSIVASVLTLYNTLKTMNLFNYFYGAVIFTALVNFILLAGLVFFPGIELYENGRFVGTMGNSNALSIAVNYCVFVSVLLLNRTKRIRLVVFLNVVVLFSLYLIFMTLSRKGFIAGALLFVFYLTSISNSKYKIIAVVFSLSLIVYVSFFSVNFSEVEEVSDLLFERFERATDFEGRNVDASTEDRLFFIESGWNLFLDKPVLGWGVNTFLLFHDGYYAHNNYIELLSGVGLVGTILYYLLYFFIFKGIIKHLKERERIYFMFLFIFFLLMDMTVVSYYFRLYFMFIAFTMAYIRTSNKEKSI